MCPSAGAVPASHAQAASSLGLLLFPCLMFGNAAGGTTGVLQLFCISKDYFAVQPNGAIGLKVKQLK